jgi:rubrerythrin
MKSLKGTATEKNLMAAFAGESQARNRYSFAASKAKKEGFEQISAIFEETADQEKAHASMFFKLLEGGECEITASFPAGGMGNTKDNLKAAADGENHEWEQLYPEFARIAEEEGFDFVAGKFRAISISEKQHEKRFRALLNNLEAGSAFKKDVSVQWRCLKCGYVHEGEEAPGNCPACAHPQAYFELLAQNW